MNNIIKQFNKTRQTEDLFHFWQDELRLRHRLRTGACANLVLSDADEPIVDFLHRSLYWTNRPLFFNILFANMNNLVIYKWLSSYPDLTREFISDLPYQILRNQPTFRELQFLINIYRAEYHSEFIRVVNVLGRSVCEELLKRTASQDFRTLLRERLVKLQKQESIIDYNLKACQPLASYPALFGDKLQVLLHAANTLKMSQPYNALERGAAKRFAQLLEAAGAVFEVGLVEDSLAILADAYVSYLDHNRTVDWDEEADLYELLYRSLRRIVPIHALFSEPTTPFDKALTCYRNWFGLVSPEPASLEFLKIYETIKEGLVRPTRNGMVEIGFKAGIIENYRPDDVFLTGMHDWAARPADLAAKLQLAASERMRALPHEAFIILEFLRLSEKCYPGSINGLNLLKDYMELWKWSPHPMFLNQEMVQELGHDISTRRQAEKMIDTESASRPNSDFMKFFARAYREGF